MKNNTALHLFRLLTLGICASLFSMFSMFSIFEAKAASPNTIEEMAALINKTKMTRMRGERREDIIRTIEAKDCQINYLTYINGLRDKDNSGTVDLTAPLLYMRKWGQESGHSGISFYGRTGDSLAFLEGDLAAGTKARDEAYDQIFYLGQLCRIKHLLPMMPGVPAITRPQMPTCPADASMHLEEEDEPGVRKPRQRQRNSSRGVYPFDPTPMEMAAFEEVNQYRRRAGLKPLIYSPEISAYARQHSQFMASGERKASHFRHSFRFKNIQKFLPWKAIGENVAFNHGYDNPAAKAVDQWHWSLGHRYLMRKDWTQNGGKGYAGMGVAKSPSGKYYFTQIFAESLEPGMYSIAEEPDSYPCQGGRVRRFFSKFRRCH